ncbi:hypothetical protein G6F32_015732 [Rhizopus arrhizus]|nr:hypothetical protein G6F32_015732 [Rhizopus arrhizus]
MGPAARMPAALASATAGARISASSLPKIPFSPACGFRPDTATGWSPRPSALANDPARRSPARMRTGVRSSMAGRSDTWVVAWKM